MQAKLPEEVIQVSIVCQVVHWLKTAPYLDGTQSHHWMEIIIHTRWACEHYFSVRVLL